MLVYSRVLAGLFMPEAPPAGAYPGGDFGHYLWNLWWVAEALRGSVDGWVYWTPYAYAPHGGVSLAAHSFSVLDGVLAAPWVWWDSSPTGVTRAFNWILAVHAMTFAGGTFLLAQRLVRNAPAAAVAATYATFYPFFQVWRWQLGSANIAVIPWLLLAVAIARDSRGWRWAAVAGGAVALQAYAYSELVLHLFLCIASFWAYTLWRPPPGHTRRDVMRKVGVMLAVATVAMTPIWIALLETAAQPPFETPPRGQVELLSTDVLSLIVPSPRQPLIGWVAPALKGRIDAGIITNDGFLGYAGLALAAVGVLRGPRRFPFPWLAAWAVLYVALSLGPVVQVGRTPFPGLPGPYAALAALMPGYSLHRVPNRLLGVAGPFLATLVGAGAVVVLQRTGRRPWLVGGLLVAVVAAEGWRPRPPAAWAFRMPTAYAALASQPPGIILHLPRHSWEAEGAYMAFQTQTRRPMAGGAISRLPRGYRELLPTAGPIRYVALHRAYYRQLPAEALTAATRALDALGRVLADDGEVRIYALPEPGALARQLPLLPAAPLPWPTDAQAAERIARVRPPAS